MAKRKFFRRKKLLLGAISSSGKEVPGGIYYFHRLKDKNSKHGYMASVDVQPKYKVTFIWRDQKGKFKDINSVKFNKKSNVTKLLLSKGFVTPNHQFGFEFPSDLAYETGNISIGLHHTQRKDDEKAIFKLKRKNKK